MVVSIIAISLIFVVLVSGAVFLRKKDKKKYGAGCAGCPYRNSCKKDEKEK